MWKWTQNCARLLIERRLRIYQKDGYIILRTGIKEMGWNKRNRIKCNKGKYMVMHLDIYKKHFYYGPQMTNGRSSWYSSLTA